jgi:hypothetical protein
MTAYSLEYQLTHHILEKKFTDQKEADNYKKDLKKLGFKIKCQKTSDGWEIIGIKDKLRED